MEDAANVPVPEGLDERILLARPEPWVGHKLAAAALGVLLVFVTGNVTDKPPAPRALYAVTQGHPALDAIAEVSAEGNPLPLDALEPDSAALDRGLERLGLELTSSQAARHVGKCHIEGAHACEHVVLSTADGHANLMLVPDFPFADRIVVSDRRMVALVNPAGTGGYIVVANSASTARRMERLLVKSRV